jgi:hypothetical protein
MTNKLDLTSNQTNSKRNWFMSHKLLTILIILAVIGLFSTIASSFSSTGDKSVKTNAAEERKDATIEEAFVYDIPGLLGKDLDQITTELGKPREVIEYFAGDKLGDRSFEKGNVGLLVTYEVASKKVVEFFLDTDDPSGGSKDTDHMLALGNLKRNDSRYSLDFVETIGRNATPGEFTGVIVKPN